MPVRILTEVERQRWTQFPTQIAPDDVIRCFTLSAADIAEIAKQRGDANRLGFALQLGALRYLGFAPDDLTTAPSDVVAYVAHQAFQEQRSKNTRARVQFAGHLNHKRVSSAHGHPTRTPTTLPVRTADQKAPALGDGTVARGRTRADLGHRCGT